MIKKLLLLFCAFVSLTVTAQTINEGYYFIHVLRSGGTVYCENGVAYQDLKYYAPETLESFDLSYIFRFEKTSSGDYRLFNCGTREYLVQPRSNGSVIYTGTTSPLEFTLERTDDKVWGFATVCNFMNVYLNDYDSQFGRVLCLWYDGPDSDYGSCFDIEAVDVSVVEALMNGEDVKPEVIESFYPELGKTYSIYSPYVSGYVNDGNSVSSKVGKENEYAFEPTGIAVDGYPTYRIRHVKSNTYLQHVELEDYLDTSDTGEWTPYGALGTAGSFTILRATKDCAVQRARSDNPSVGEWVICDTRTHYVSFSEVVLTYLGGYGGRTFFSPWTDSNNMRIAEFKEDETTTPDETQQGNEDQSVELWGEPTATLALLLDNGVTLMVTDNMVLDDDPQNGRLTLRDGSVVEYLHHVEEPIIDESYPNFRTFKFNNKYNDVMFNDANGNIDDFEINIDVASIGKTLCPSFSLTDETATAYIGGQRQLSHQNRIRFAGDVTYTIALPNHKRLIALKTSDEVWNTPEATHGGEQQVVLSVEQLSTNAPSGRGEGLDKMIDGNTNTYFHSTWSNDPVYNVLPYSDYNPNATVWPYVDIALNKPLSAVKFKFTMRNNQNGRNPKAIDLQASHDGQNWTTMGTMNNMPSGASEVYESDVIEFGEEYEYLRLQETECYYKNYMCFAEMELYSVTPVTDPEPPTLVQPAEYSFEQRPWGREVTVHANFLTDQAARVPEIHITLDDGVPYSSITKTSYLPATIRIDGAGVWPDMDETPVNMRGRGNSSWLGWRYGSYYPTKNPFRLKFGSKVKPFGLTKGKSWCLIAQAQKGSLLTNPVAQRVATMIGTPGANHCVPVDLYINNEYFGSYMFTENPGFSNNSIDVDESDAYMLELDSYYDETYRFRDSYFSLPVNVKEPDLAEETDKTAASEKFNVIRDQFNEFTRAVYEHDYYTYEKKMDIDSWSRFMLVNDVVRNTELMHPKSTKLYSENMMLDDYKYYWGPCWDFDWAFGYEGGRNYCINSAETDFYEAIAKNNTGGTQGSFFKLALNASRTLMSERYYVWTEFMENYRNELIDYVEDYYQYARGSFENNETVNSDGSNYAGNVANMKDWLRQRTDWVYNNLTKYPLPEKVYALGDVNLDGRISVGDAICIANHILQLPIDVFNEENADMNADNRITAGDLQLVIRAILEAEEVSSSIRQRMPRAAVELTVEPFVASANDETEVGVMLTAEEAVSGLQMEVVLPEGATLTNVRTADALSPFRTRISNIGGNRYRVLAMPQNGERIENGTQSRLTLDVTMGEVPARKADRVVRLNNIILSSPEGTDMAATNARGMFAEPTGVDGITADEITVRGGDDLRIESVKDGTVDVYNLAGQMVRRVAVTRGTTSVNLPMGIYIVAGTKIMID